MSGLLEIRREGRLLRVAMNRPEKRNALNAVLCQELIAAFADAQSDAGIGAVLLSGNGKSFSAGMDLDEALTPEISLPLADLHDRLFTAYSWLGKPLVAAVHGAALAGGTGLVANAHIAIAAEDASFGLTEIRLGLWPFLIFRAVMRAMGERRAVELSLTGRTFGAREAVDYGLVHEAVPAANLGARAAEIAANLAEASPAAVSSGLAYVENARSASLEEAGRIARSFRHQIFESQEFRRRVEDFRNKRHQTDGH
jgi:enoyl-CoA hydratase/carnithine racemase